MDTISLFFARGSGPNGPRLRGRAGRPAGRLAAWSGSVLNGLALEAPRRAGRLEIGFARGPGGESYLGHQYAAYPFHICRARRVEGDPPGMATLYLQSVSGGVYGGDRLETELVMDAGAQAHVTTQASTVVHGMVVGEATQGVRIEAGPGALLEFMPDPLILFPHAKLETKLRILCDPSATVLIADAFMFHDPRETGAPFGILDSTLEVVEIGGALLARDRFRLDGATYAEGRRGIMGGNLVHATFLVLDRARPADVLLAALRDALGSVPGVYAGASTLPRGCGVWARLLAADGAAAKAGLQAVWAAARLVLTGAVPAPRRK